MATFQATGSTLEPTAHGTAVPLVVLFERDDSIAVPLLSQLRLAGYDVRAARTPVELFDVTGKHQVALVLVDMGSATAGRREFWIALDAQRRGRTMQVMTFRYTQPGSIVDTDFEPTARAIADVEVRGAHEFQRVIDGVRHRVPLQGALPGGWNAPSQQAPGPAGGIPPIGATLGIPSPFMPGGSPVVQPLAYPEHSYGDGSPNPFSYGHEPPGWNGRGNGGAPPASAGQPTWRHNGDVRPLYTGMPQPEMPGNSPFDYPAGANPFAEPAMQSPFAAPLTVNPFANDTPAAYPPTYASFEQPVRNPYGMGAPHSADFYQAEADHAAISDVWIPPDDAPIDMPSPNGYSDYQNGRSYQIEPEAYQQTAHAAAAHEYSGDVGQRDTARQAAPSYATPTQLPAVQVSPAERALGSVLVEGALLSPQKLEALKGVQQLLASVDMQFRLGELALLFKFLSPDQLLAALLVSRGMVSPQQIAGLGRVKQELAASGMDYDLETLLATFHILPRERLRSLRAELGG